MKSKSTSRVLQRPFALLVVLVRTAASVQLPYNPARILISPQNGLTAYVLKQSSGPQFQLASLDLSSKITGSDVSLTALSPTLPFLNDTGSVSFSAIIDSAGNITVYAGDCSQGAGSAQLWSLDTSKKPNGGIGTWTTSTPTLTNGILGPSYLTSAITFSPSSTDPDTRAYLFGGMCPSPNTTPDTWISSSTYSNTMLYLTPRTGKLLADSSQRGAPVPQAGHSFTGLSPTFSNQTAGTKTQYQSFVLLGGHTSSAFVNMSQLALFSLPQETWTYISVSSVTGALEPRSGHTAVMSSDGKNVIVLGGWIGDVNTPASPQLAVLNIADGYGGTGNWKWTVPSPAGPGPSSGSGLYGHASVMLSGNVMLVLGGYSISSQSTRKRTASDQPLNTNFYLYNVSSNTWITEYVTPPASSYNGEAEPATGPLSKKSQKAGLGVGLAAAGIAVALLFLFYLWYKRRLRQRREAREQEIRALGGIPFESDEWGMGGWYDRSGSYVPGQEKVGEEDFSAAQHSLHYGYHAGWRNSNSQDAERAVLTPEPPSPTRGIRKPATGRGPYPYQRSSRNRDSIHPIAERDEDEGDTPKTKEAGLGMSERTRDLNDGSPPSGPFISPLGSHPTNGPRTHNEVAEGRELEVRSWVSGWERAAEELLHGPETSASRSGPGGRVSPTKSDRTLSSLSNMSAYSSRSLARTLSTRSAAILSSLTSPFMSTTSGALENVSPSSGSVSPTDRPPHGYRPPTSPTKDSANSSPIKSSFTSLQAEGEALLGRYHPYGPTQLQTKPKKSSPPLNIIRLNAPPTNDPGSTGSPSSPVDLSPTRTRPSHSVSERKAYTNAAGTNWLVGSVKRVISSSLGGRSASLTAATKRKPVPDSTSHQSQATGISTSASPHDPDTTGIVPRRAASDAAFWKSKRGAQDWGEEDVPAGEGGEDDEWDVEAAAQNRVVQLMFTVPREQLRIVNADDDDGASVVSFDGRADKEDAAKGKEVNGRNGN